MLQAVTYSALPAVALKEDNHRKDELLGLADKAGLSNNQLSAIKALVRWREVLFSPEPEQRLLYRRYLEALGYMPEDHRVVSSAFRSNGAKNGIVDKLMLDFASDPAYPDRFLSSDLGSLCRDYSGIGRSRLSLLKSFIRQESVLDTLDLSSLAVHFPFPITQYNFFGRFIAGGCSEPQQAVRHLRFSTPFFIRMRSLIEGLANDSKHFLVLFGWSVTGDDYGAASMKPISRDAAQIVTACLNHSEDFTAATRLTSKSSLVCIELPETPTLDMKRVDPKERTKLAAEFMNWLLLGDRSGELLNRRTLSLSQETAYQHKKGALKRLRKELREIKKGVPKGDDVKSLRLDVRRWERRIERAEHRIEKLGDDIAVYDAERKHVRPLIRQLDSEGRTKDMREFRRKVAEAQSKGRRMVFCVLQPAKAETFLGLLDTAWNSRKCADAAGIRALRSSAFILSPKAKQMLDKNHYPSSQSIVSRHIRNFEVDEADINKSVQYIVAGILPERNTATIASLTLRLSNIFSIPGVQTQSQLTYLVQEWSGSRNPKVYDYLEYVCEHAVRITEDQFQSLCGSLLELGHNSLPQRCCTLLTTRFGIAPSLIDSFERYASSYYPSKLGELPELFDDLATLRSFHDLKFDACGMQPELKILQRHLLTTGTVGIVAALDYHPELGLDVGGEKVHSDQEKTREIWGDYVRPSQRLVRALARSLMDGTIADGLSGYSLVGVRNPGAAGKIAEHLLKKFYGIDVDVTPDLGEVNRMLSDLAVYDSRTILVLDASNVKDLKQYREFVEELRRHCFKVVIANLREPLPGLPNIVIEPFLDAEVPDRLIADGESLNGALGVRVPISPDIIRFAAERIEAQRQPSDDPLNLVCHVLDSAAQHALMNGYEEISRHDIVAAVPAIFHLPTMEQKRAKVRVVESFMRLAPLQVLGQPEAIRTIGQRMKSHLLSLRDPRRPLALLLPGPTGVGKTELMYKFAMAVNMPFFPIEGSQFQEGHTLSRLIGSPSGYVGPEEGILFKFLKDNTFGLVFIDEIEKMHQDVYLGLLNFFDKAVLTSGSGEQVKRPGMVIVGASNAGAEELYRGINDRELREVLSRAFGGKPELVARFEAVPMLALTRDDFEQVLALHLREIGNRFGFIAANLRLVGIDSSAGEMLLEEALMGCRYDEKAVKRQLGFGGGSPSEMGHSELFHDIRHVSRALERLAGSSVEAVVQQQLDSGNYLEREKPRSVMIIGNRSAYRLELVDVP